MLEDLHIVKGAAASVAPTTLALGTKLPWLLIDAGSASYAGSLPLFPLLCSRLELHVVARLGPRQHRRQPTWCGHRRPSIVFARRRSLFFHV